MSAWLNKARPDITNRKPLWVPLSDLFPSGKASGGQVRMPDISGDGRADYVAMGENGSARAWVNIPPRADAPPESAPEPTWRERGQFNPWVGTNGNQIRFAEINGDRRADYLQIHENGTVQAFVNTHGQSGKPDWVDWGLVVPRGFSGQVRFADVNGDGRDDYLLLAGNGVFRAFLNTRGGNGKPSWDDQGVIDPGVGATRDEVAFADVNGDGRDDYLRVGPAGAVHAFLNTEGANGKPRWVEHRNWANGVTEGSRERLRLADVNADRKADYLIVGPTGAVNAYLNNGGGGKGSFIKRLRYFPERGIPHEKVAFADITGDGRADYLWIERDGSVRGWLNRGGN